MIIVLCVIIGIVKKIRRSRQNNINGGISIVLTETDKMIVCMIFA